MLDPNCHTQGTSSSAHSSLGPENLVDWYHIHSMWIRLQGKQGGVDSVTRIYGTFLLSLLFPIPTATLFNYIPPPHPSSSSSPTLLQWPTMYPYSTFHISQRL